MLVIGHRGAAAVAPENTLAAFAAALDGGVTAVECDARLTNDGVVVLMHDDDVSRTTGGSGRISEMRFEQVRALDAAANASGWRGGPQTVPTLGELLELVDGRATVVIELKADLDDRGYRPATPVARAVVPMVAGLEGVVVSSFDPDAVAAVRAQEPTMPTALSILRGFPIDDGITAAVRAGHVEIHPAHDGVDDEVVARAHVAGLSVHCWTVNDPDRAQALNAAGVDGIFSDDPVAMLAALA